MQQKVLFESEGFLPKKEKKSNYSCSRCGLYEHAKTYKMQPFGDFKQRILNIGEAPGNQEDIEGKQWQGRVGQYLQKVYTRFGIDLFKDCININAVNCRPEKNKTPTDIQISCCREVVLKDVLKKYNPDLIMLFGNSAIKSFLGHRWKKDLGGIFKWRGWHIPDQDYRAWVCPVFHPSFVVRSEDFISRIWAKDIRNALTYLDKRFPTYKEPEIEVIENLERLKEIKSDLTAFDYETTGLKPQKKGHRIVVCGIADTPDHAFVFKMPEEHDKRKPFIDYLQNKDISKIAANMSFEDTWSNVILGTQVKGWTFDTMLGAHILDNRQGITGLKFQVYANYGVVDYTSDVDSYIYGEKSKGNDFNDIEQLEKTQDGLSKLLRFVGLDAVFEYRLGMQQIEQLDYNFLPF
jgi:DNA polymerase